MHKPILYAEDDDNDAFFMRRAVTEAGIANPVEIVTDGRTAIEYLSGVGEFADRSAYPLPFLVLLDLKLPAVSGLEVLRWIRSDSRFRDIQVVVLAAFAGDRNIREAVRLGANTYIVKPPTAASLLSMARALGQQGFALREAVPRSS